MAGPLKGLRILDFTTLLPGPFATMMMADMGADVLRIVSGSRPDLAALMPPFVPGTKLSSNTAYLHRGKRCMTLNLKKEAAVRIVHRLLRSADVLVEQFRPGVMASFGLGYEDVRRINPRVIYCSITGYGQTGPLAQRAGHDINYLALSGLMSHSGRKEGGPSLLGTQIADLAGGSLLAAIGVLAAVVCREKTGEGQHIDIAMADGATALQALSAAAFLVDGQDPAPESGLFNGGSLYDFYETRDGRYLSVGSLEPKFFETFCRTIGRPDLAEGGVLPLDLPRVKSEIREIIRSRSLAEWMELFRDTDACVEPVLSLSEAFRHPHAVARKLAVEVKVPGGGTIRQPATPLRFSHTPIRYGDAGVAAGTHTEDVLRELGYSEEEIERLEKEGVFS